MKKEVLYIDKWALNTANVQGVIQENILNNLISKTEEKLKNVFSDEEKVKLKDNAGGLLRSWIKQFYQFPNATDEFNNQAIGIDLEAIIREFYDKSKLWNKYLLNIVDGKFQYDQKGTIKRYTTFTSNEFQNNALSLANELIELVDKGIKQGILLPKDGIKISEAFIRIVSLKSGHNPDKLHNLIPNVGISVIPQHPLPKKKE